MTDIRSVTPIRGHTVVYLNMKSTEWLVLQICLSIIVIVIATCLLHLLAQKHQAGANQQAGDRKWLRVGFSLSFAHILSGCGLFSTAFVTLVVRYFGGGLPEMELVEAHIYTLSAICVMLHTLCIMINDFKTTIQQAALPEENNFYIVLTWVTVCLCIVLLTIIQQSHSILKILSIIILICDAFLIVAYTEIIRRSYVALRRAQEFGHEFSGACAVTGRNKHILILGVMIAASLILFTVPFAFERLIWKQNKAVSFMCVSLNAIAQGLICITRLCIK